MKTIIPLRRSFARIGIVGLVIFPVMLALSVVAFSIAPAAGHSIDQADRPATKAPP